MTDRWDVLVVGGGTAGIVSSKTAAGFGARVLLVERNRTGGDCLWTGCVPSKSLLAAASAAATPRYADALGVHTDGVRVDFARVMAHVRGAIAAIEPVDSPEALRAAGVAVVHGDLRFTGRHRAEVGGREIAFDQAIVCTGSSPTVPGIPGLADAEPLTSDTVWDLEVLPERLAVLGGGNIGCELGQAFARLGSSVTVVEAEDRLLPREDERAADVVAASLRRDGADLVLGVPVTEVKPGEDGSGRLVLEDGRTVDYDRLLVSIGRTPGTGGLGLAAAGVEVEDRGFVRVDRHLRSSNPYIWAAGDVTGHPQFTHTAGVHGSLAASNAVLGLRRKVDLATNPRVTYTHPEVAAVGVSPDQARRNARSTGLTVVTRDHDEVDRAVTEAETDGYTSIVVDRKGRLLGATVVGPRAGETLGELTLAIREGLRTRDLAGTTHAYPTWNDGAWNATIEDVRSQLRSGATARAIRTLSRARRGWVRRRANRA